MKKCENCHGCGCAMCKFTGRSYDDIGKRLVMASDSHGERYDRQWLELQDVDATQAGLEAAARM